ncbi:MAG: marine proteobacterial sortase target protein [Deinococcota bacterium]
MSYPNALISRNTSTLPRKHFEPVPLSRSIINLVATTLMMIGVMLIGSFSYGQPSHGQPSYGQPSYEQPSHRQPSYGQQHSRVIQGVARNTESDLNHTLVSHAATSQLAQASPATDPFGDAAERINLDDVSRGELLFYSEAGFVPAPQLAVDVDIQVTGMVARVVLEQRFTNPTNTWLEGIYVFPLAEDAAVDTLTMIVGERRIEGVIQRREEARANYEAALEAGQQASLVEQERPNMFTTSVANIAPGETITVEIGYLETLRYDQNAFSLRFPLAITPRYIPGYPQDATYMSTPGELSAHAPVIQADEVSSTLTVSNRGWAGATAQVPDAPRITPPVAPPGVDTGTRVTLRAQLDAGFPLAQLSSLYHDIQQTRQDDSISLELTGPIVPDRDFVLTWSPAIDSAPEAARFQEQADGHDYALVMVMPPKVMAAPSLPREMIFIIDTSGSMEGGSLEQAKEALIVALDRLGPDDRFNIIEFNSVTKALFRQTVDADIGNIRRAKGLVLQLEATGGTEMAPALERALGGRPPEGFLRQVVFITDGSVGNEVELFGQIQRDLRGARLFTVGIGSAPNSFFMRKAAEAGRGSYTYIGDLREVQGEMQTLFTKLENPVITNLTVRLPEGSDAYPETIPDLYLGEPVVLSVRLPERASNADIVIAGEIAGNPWERRLLGLGSQVEDDAGDDVDNARQGLRQLWARAKVDSLEDNMLGEDNEGIAKLEERITQVALEHSLVSAYTSLVAIDVTPIRPENADATSGEVPQTLPAGQSYDAIFGGYPNTATPSLRHLFLGVLALVLAIIGLVPNRSHSKKRNISNNTNRGPAQWLGK